MLLRHDIALLAAHLPLDAHPELGNNATMASLLGLQDIQPFGLYHGTYIGYRGRFESPVEISDIARTLELGPGTGLHILPFGKKHVSTVGIVSGGAAFEVQQAISLGLDAYITGESSHTMYFLLQGVAENMICAAPLRDRGVRRAADGEGFVGEPRPRDVVHRASDSPVGG